MPSLPSSAPNPDAYWMPFTANRRVKRDPVLFSAAEGMHYIRPDGRRVLDGIAGLWCVNAGHRRPEIVEAIARTAYELDYAPSFQMGHPLAFELADALCAEAPAGFSSVFLFELGIRGGRHRLEDRAGLSPGTWPGPARAADRA